MEQGNASIERLIKSIETLSDKIDSTSAFENGWRDAITKSLNENYKTLRSYLTDEKNLLEKIADETKLSADETKEYLDLIAKKEKAEAKLSANSGTTYGAAIQQELNAINKKLQKYASINFDQKDVDAYLDAKNNELLIQQEILKLEKERAKVDKEIAKWSKNIQRVWDATVKTIKPGVDKWHEMERLSKATARSMGMNAKQSEAYMKSLGNVTRKLAYNYGMTVEEVDKIQNSIVKATNKSVILNETQQENLVAMSKLGSSEVADQFLETVDKFGGSSDDAVRSFGQAYGNAAKLGLNAQKASAAVAKNMALLNTYGFKNGIDGITRMTMLAQKLRIDLTSAANVVGKFENLDDAIQATAQMQVLGGTGGMLFGNALENFSQALIDPEALIEKMAKITAGKGTFNRATGMVDMGAFDKRMIREQAKALGISQEELMTIANQTARNKEISKEIKSTAAGKNLTEEQITLLQNKATWDKEKQQFNITYFDEEGNKIESNIKALLSSDAESQKKMFSALSNEKDVQTLIQGDVRKIAQQLVDRESKNKGFFEQWKVANAQVLDGPIKTIYGLFDSFANSSVWKILTDGNFGTGMAMGGLFGARLFAPNLTKNLARSIVESLHGINGGNTFVRPTTPTPTTPTTPNAPLTQTPNPTTPPNGGLTNTSRAKSAFNKFKNIGGRFGTLGKVVGGGLSAAFAIGSALSEYKNAKNENREQVDALSHTDLSENSKKAIAQQIEKQFDNKKYNAIATAVGSIIGGAIGSVGGPLGAMIGGYLGQTVGSSIFGTDNRSTKEMINEYSETSKFGTEALKSSGEVLRDNAARATIKMHDLLISIWYHMNGKQSNGAIENKGIVGNLKEGKILGAIGSIFQSIFSTEEDKKSNAHYIKANNGSVEYFGENASGGMVDKTIAIPKELHQVMNQKGEDGLAAVKKNELIVTPDQIKNLTKVIGQNPNIVSKPTVGGVTKILHNDSIAPTYSSNKDFNININGTLKLDASSLGANSVKLDMNALMNNPAFKAQIFEIIKNSMCTINGKTLRDNQFNKLGRIQSYGGI